MSREPQPGFLSPRPKDGETQGVDPVSCLASRVSFLQSRVPGTIGSAI